MSTYDDVHREAMADRRNDDIEPWWVDYTEEYLDSPCFDGDEHQVPYHVYEDAALTD